MLTADGLARARSFRTSAGLVNKSIHPKAKSKQAELGEHKGGAFFLDRGELKYGCRFS